MSQAISRHLNQRQQDVLCLVHKGLRNSEIALHLGLSVRTIKGYVNQLFLIFEVTNRAELAGAVADEHLMTSTTPEAARVRPKVPHLWTLAGSDKADTLDLDWSI